MFVLRGIVIAGVDLPWALMPMYACLPVSGIAAIITDSKSAFRLQFSTMAVCVNTLYFSVNMMDTT